MSGDAKGGGTQHKHEIVLAGMVNVTGTTTSRASSTSGLQRVQEALLRRQALRRARKPSVGFEDVPEERAVGISTCTDIKGVYMMSLGVKPGKVLKHTCPR